MQDHIIFIGEVDKDADALAEWTATWLTEHEVDIEPTLYVCSDIETAKASIEAPLAMANPPALVIINHGENDLEMKEFSELLKRCIPESWVVDLLHPSSELPDSEGSFAVLRPVHKEDWFSFLEHLFFKAQSPQWSRALNS